LTDDISVEGPELVMLPLPGPLAVVFGKGYGGLNVDGILKEPVPAVAPLVKTDVVVLGSVYGAIVVE